MSFSISVEDTKNPDVLGEKLMDLAGIVFRKHFYASFSEKDDLLSVGVLKALFQLESGNFDGTKGTMLNFLYTGMRNEMHNYLYHHNKKIRGDEIVSDVVIDVYFEKEAFEIDISLVKEVCKSFEFYGDLFGYVVKELIGRGFCLIGKCQKVCKTKICASEELLKDTLDRLCGVIIWRSREFSL